MQDDFYRTESRTRRMRAEAAARRRRLLAERDEHAGQPTRSRRATGRRG